MTRNLDDYNRMRDFSATSEPAAKRSGKTKAKDHALQFCIQKHDASRLHYDFRLELDVWTATVDPSSLSAGWWTEPRTLGAQALPTVFRKVLVVAGVE